MDCGRKWMNSECFVGIGQNPYGMAKQSWTNIRSKQKFTVRVSLLICCYANTMWGIQTHINTVTLRHGMTCWPRWGWGDLTLFIQLKPLKSAKYSTISFPTVSSTAFEAVYKKKNNLATTCIVYSDSDNEHWKTHLWDCRLHYNHIDSIGCKSAWLHRWLIQMVIQNLYAVKASKISLHLLVSYFRPLNATKSVQSCASHSFRWSAMVNLFSST